MLAEERRERKGWHAVNEHQRMPERSAGLACADDASGGARVWEESPNKRKHDKAARGMRSHMRDSIGSEGTGRQHLLLPDNILHSRAGPSPSARVSSRFSSGRSGGYCADRPDCKLQHPHYQYLYYHLPVTKFKSQQNGYYADGAAGF